MMMETMNTAAMLNTLKRISLLAASLMACATVSASRWEGYVTCLVVSPLFDMIRVTTESGVCTASDSGAGPVGAGFPGSMTVCLGSRGNKGSAKRWVNRTKEKDTAASNLSIEPQFLVYLKFLCVKSRPLSTSTYVSRARLGLPEPAEKR